MSTSLTANLNLAAAREPICVAQLIGRFDRGGAQRLACNLATALGRTDCRSFLLGAMDQAVPESLATGPVTAMSLGARRGNPLSILKSAMRLRRLICDEGIDLLHVHGSPTLLLASLATLGMRGRCAVAFTWHDSEHVLPARGLLAAPLRLAIRRCDARFGSSAAVAAQLADRVGTTEPFINGVPVTPPRPSRDTPEPVIVWVGRFVPAKDPAALVQAAASLRDEGLQFRVRIIGDAPPGQEWRRVELQSLVVQLSLQDNVELMGWVQDIPAALRQADIGVQTSRTEGLSMALLEQMMCRLAVVATDVGDTATAIENEVGGLLVPARDIAALTAQLRRVLVSPALRRRLGNAARDRAVEQFSLDAMAQRALAAYRRAMGRPS